MDFIRASLFYGTNRPFIGDLCNFYLTTQRDNGFMKIRSYFLMENNEERAATVSLFANVDIGGFPMDTTVTVTVAATSFAILSLNTMMHRPRVLPTRDVRSFSRFIDNPRI